MLRLKETASGLLLSCLVTLQTSCATLKAPPEQYLKDCTTAYIPAGGKPTQATLYKLAVDREADVRNCNADKRAIRAWYETYCDAKGRGCKVQYGSDK